MSGEKSTPYPLTTEFLSISPLALSDNSFIFELVNSQGWLDFIGDRNIHSAAAACTYIQKILDNESVFYWVVRLARDCNPIGVVTFIKRDYLEYHDVGFAFLPKYEGQRHACKATLAVLDFIGKEYTSSHIQATTVPENTRSIALLKKLGMEFEKEMEIDQIRLHIYSVSTSRLLLR